MSEELKKVLEELRQITNKFNITGQGISGNILKGFTIETETGQGGPVLPTPP